MQRPGAWSRQTAVTRAGEAAPWIEGLPDSIESLREASRRLVFHYSAGGDWAENGAPGDRLAEVDTRFAEAMFARLAERQRGPLTADRPARNRVVGCCRDFTVLFLSMAREKVIPARARVGYGTYFVRDWFLDHVEAEVWDADEKRWRLVEPEIEPDFAPADGSPFDPLDVPPERFLTGPRAWLAARSGAVQASRFVVSPDLEEPYTRGWLSLRHHLVQDLLSLAGAEMLLWDQWGILLDPDPLGPEVLPVLDELAEVLSHPDLGADLVGAWAQHQYFSLPSTVESFSPADDGPRSVDVTPVLSSP